MTYTLNPQREAPEIEGEIKKSPGWAHAIDFTWIIATEESVNELYSRLAPNFRISDHLLIVEITTNATYQGWLPKNIWEWLKGTRNY